jgi:hypothetical protein
VTIENLQPDHQYVIRIVTLNSANFQAPSVPIRLRTLPADSDQFYNTAPHKETTDGADDDDYTPTPIIRPNKNLVDIIIPPITAPIMTREHSNSTSRVRRLEPGRRSSPASQALDPARSAQEAAESMESIKQLTEKLDALRREIDDVEKQIQDEDEEFQTTKLSLLEKRDEKRSALKEKEDASRDLRKEVATLDRANAAAQAKRTQQEKLLRQKEVERQKLKDDVARWARETGELREAAERIQQERAEYESTAESRIQALKDKYAEEVQTNKGLEDVIREKGIQIKQLEEERKQLEEGEENGDAQDGNDTVEADEDRRWIITLNALQQRYAHAWALFNEAERANQESNNRLQYLSQRRMSQPQLFTGLSQELHLARRNSQRARPLSMRETLTSAVPGGFIHTTAPTFNNTMSSASPTFQNATPYFNFQNGTSFPASNHMSFSQADVDNMTGGAPMSPTAGALLPSGLFGDDTGLTDAEDDEDDPGPPQDPSPNLRHVLPGLGAPGTLEQVQSPGSPVSAGAQSRSPSIFASPRDSAGQLAHYPTQDQFDSDKRSIRSTSSSFANHPPTTRFGNLFGLHRQRGKTFSDQGLPLGSLKLSQSQSLPRQDPGASDPSDNSHRRGSHTGGAWYDAFVRASKTQPVEPPTSPKHVATRKRPFNMFGSKDDPWLTSALGLGGRPSPPRQGSAQSGESNLLPRPSTESQTRFGWSANAFDTRSSPLGVDWSMNHRDTHSWSRMPSRRPSIQHGSTTSLLNENFLQGDQSDFLPQSFSPTQAPIGTRPQSSASHIPPTPPKMLNPTAPQFKSIFTRAQKNEEDKAEKAKKVAEKAAEKEAKKAERREEKKAKAERSEKTSRKIDFSTQTFPKPAVTNSVLDTNSPVASRQSRDNYSISTADASDASPRESLERSISQTTTESQAHLNAFGKETFMQKLSRKSSSSQFLPFGKGKATLFSKRPSDVVTPDEKEEDASSFLGRSVESSGNSPSLGTPKDKASALSWSSIKRMGKRGDKTPSLHESVTSEATGDEDEEAEAHWERS